MSTDDETPAFRFVGGNPTDEEIAAVVAVLSHRTSATSATGEPPSHSGWAGYWRRTRRSLRPGPNAWRFSLRG